LALLHELRVHEEELITQRERLVAAQVALTDARDQYSELYEFAPNTYLTLDQQGLIQQINLTGTALLGRPRQAVVGLPMLVFVDPADRHKYLEYLRQCRAQRSGRVPAIELVVVTADGPRAVQLIGRPRQATKGKAREFFTAIVDLSHRKGLEAERQKLADQQTEWVRRVISAQEDQRRRIARDLHDQLGQQMTGLRLKLELLASASQENGAQKKLLADAQRIAEEIDRHLDFFTGELRPAMLDDLGLVAAIRQFVQQWGENFGIRADFHSSGLEERRLDSDVETQVYRIVQEALHNVYKHAKARHVGVMLEHRDSHLVLIVEDDGSGFRVSQIVSQGSARGLGLIGMRERAALVGGSMEIESSPGRGTTIFLQVPWTEAGATPAESGVNPHDADPAAERRQSPRAPDTAARTPAARRHQRAADSAAEAAASPSRPRRRQG
jgi:PAS domain S-box-containing protein